jgi:7-cyano-7-deazaguanine synthase in queuosine biosynthesis|tara:strand:- start:17 stop:439 length:423 start_codon:yes stop_codon:yes gene_type:complete
MKVSKFFKWARKEFDKEMNIMDGKGIEYTVSDKDKLKNFKSIAERLDTKASNIAMVYLLKHMDSIRNYVLNGVEASDETISGRVRDARNYLLLLHAIILEEKGDVVVKEAGEKDSWFGKATTTPPIKFTMADAVEINSKS